MITNIVEKQNIISIAFEPHEFNEIKLKINKDLKNVVITNDNEQLREYFLINCSFDYFSKVQDSLTTEDQIYKFDYTNFSYTFDAKEELLLFNIGYGVYKTKVGGYVLNTKMQFPEFPKYNKVKFNELWEMSSKILNTNQVGNFVLTDQVIKESRHTIVDTVEEYKKFLELNIKMDQFQEFYSLLLDKLSGELNILNNIEVDPALLEVYSRTVFLQQTQQLIKENGSLESFLKINNINKEQFDSFITTQALSFYSMRVLIDEINNKYIYKKDENLFNELLDITTFNSNQKYIELNKNYKYDTKLLWEQIQAFLKIVELKWPEKYKEYFLNKKFPYIQ